MGATFGHTRLKASAPPRKGLSMPAAIVTRFGAPDVLEVSEMPDPIPAPGELLIDVTYAAVAEPWHDYARVYVCASCRRHFWRAVTTTCHLRMRAVFGRPVCHRLPRVATTGLH